MPAKGVATERELEEQEFWDDLFYYIVRGKVVPVIGPELHTVASSDGREVRLYSAIANELLRYYGLQGREAANAGPNSGDEIILKPHRELHDAVSAVMRVRRKKADDLCPRINDALLDLLRIGAKIPQALYDLAKSPISIYL
jgi:hypothetical protein